METDISSSSRGAFSCSRVLMERWGDSPRATGLHRPGSFSAKTTSDSFKSCFRNPWSLPRWSPLGPNKAAVSWKVWRMRWRLMVMTSLCRHRGFLLKGRPCTRQSGPWCSPDRGTHESRTGGIGHSWRAGGQTGARSVWSWSHRPGAPGNHQNAPLFGN